MHSCQAVLCLARGVDADGGDIPIYTSTHEQPMQHIYKQLVPSYAIGFNKAPTINNILRRATSTTTFYEATTWHTIAGH